MIESDSAPEWWSKLSWQLYERLPAGADDILEWGPRCVCPFRNLSVPLVVLRGSTRPDCHPVTAVFVMRIIKHDNHYNFLVRWNRLNGPVTSFLSSTPLIFRERGGFSAVCVIGRDGRVTEAKADKIRRSMWMPGLCKLYLVSISGYQPGINSPPQTDLFDAATIAESCDLRKLR